MDKSLNQLHPMDYYSKLSCLIFRNVIGVLSEPHLSNKSGTFAVTKSFSYIEY